VPERQRSAAALLRLRDRQRDAAALQLAATRSRQQVAEADADACRRRVAETESDSIAQHAPGGDFDPQRAVLVHRALDHAFIASLHADACAQAAADDSKRAQEQCARRECARRLAEKFHQRMQQVLRMASTRDEARDALQAQQSQHRHQEWP
jgi:hypothetical protein